MTGLRAFYGQTLLHQFVIAGGFVMLVAALLVGSWVESSIKQGVVQNSANAAALYMESYISPLSAELATDEGLSDPARVALREIFLGTALGERVVSYKIWKKGGRIIEASNPELRGRVFELSDDQRAAWNGNIAASFEDLTDLEDQDEAAMQVPLLEVYSPVRAVWTGEIVAVAEFYERADLLAQELTRARRNSWLIVLAVFAVSGLLLYGIVRTGSHLIEQQESSLKLQLVETQRISEQNSTLKDRIAAAAQRSTTQADRVMQRIGQDLHDGVAQYLSLASLRFEEACPENGKTADTVRAALDSAMTELRAISRGLALPDLEDLSLSQTICRCVQDHQNTFKTAVEFERFEVPDLDVEYAVKLCIYRFLQEALTNAVRHGGVETADVEVFVESDMFTCIVSDDGPGFDPESAMTVRPDGGQGMLGLRDRAATLTGHVDVKSSPGHGSKITLTLPISETST